jgi:hypothetical protein
MPGHTLRLLAQLLRRAKHLRSRHHQIYQRVAVAPCSLLDLQHPETSTARSRLFTLIERLMLMAHVPACVVMDKR